MLVKFTVMADINIPLDSTGSDIALAMKGHIEKTALDELDYYIEAY